MAEASSSSAGREPEAISFSGYVLATADPGSEAEDRPAEISTDAVLEKLRQIGGKQPEKLRQLVYGVCEELEGLARENALRQQGEAERQRELEQAVELRRLEGQDERRRQRLQELREARERRAQEEQNWRERVVINFREALNQCKSMVEEHQTSQIASIACRVLHRIRLLAAC